MKIYLYKKTPDNNTIYYIKKSYEKAYGKACDVTYKKTGRPYIDDDIFVGVTHTDELIIIAFNESNFGIDAEKEDRVINKKTKLIDKYFTKDEKEYISNNADSFLEMWVKKEAFVKTFEKGIADMKKSSVLNAGGKFKKIKYAGYIIYVYFEKEAKITSHTIDEN